jgi:hypothetical protein
MLEHLSMYVNTANSSNWQCRNISVCTSTPPAVATGNVGTSQYVRQHKAQPRKPPPGVEMASRSVAGPSGCELARSQQQSGKQKLNTPTVKDSVSCSWLANSSTGTAQQLFPKADDLYITVSMFVNLCVRYLHLPLSRIS